MKMLGNTAWLSPLQFEESRGIVVPVKYRSNNMQWVVLAVGNGKRLKDGTRLMPDIRPGDHCLYNLGLSGTKHSFEDGTIVVDIKDILMVWQ